jgi:TatD DNase family protein
MNLIDTHAHLYLEEFDNDREQVIGNAIRSGVKRILCPNIDSQSIDALEKLCNSYPDLCLPMMGLHPTSVKDDYKTELEIIQNKLFGEKDKNYIAIGEIGIDLYWDQTYYAQQVEAFSQQLAWAVEKKLPVAIHTRNSFDQTMEVLNNFEGIKGVFHCFSGNLVQAEKVIEKGFLLGIGGVVTFKNSGLDKVVQAIDLSKLIIETDAPFLAPMPYRGKRNESAYVTLVAQKIAALKNCFFEEVCIKTTHNASELFNFADQTP